MCIATDQDLEKLRKWVTDHEVSVPVFSLATDELPLVFDSDYIPATYLLAADARIAFRHEGAAQWDHPRVVSFPARVADGERDHPCSGITERRERRAIFT